MRGRASPAVSWRSATMFSAAMKNCPLFDLAVGETFISADTPFFIPVKTPTKGRWGCSRMAVSPTATSTAQPAQ